MLWNCSRRWVLTNVPSFSGTPAAGIRKTSVAMSSMFSSPRATSGELYQNKAGSVSTKSRTTSHFSLAKALRSRRPFGAPTAGILPHDEQTFELAVHHVEPITKMGVIAGHPRQPVETEVVLFGRCIAVIRLQETDDVFVKVRPPTRPHSCWDQANSCWEHLTPWSMLPCYICCESSA